MASAKERRRQRRAGSLEGVRQRAEAREAEIQQLRVEVAWFEGLLESAQTDLDYLRRRLREEVEDKHRACEQRDAAREERDQAIAAREEALGVARLGAEEVERLRARVAEIETEDRDTAKLRQRLQRKEEKLKELRSWASHLESELRRAQSGGFTG